MKLFRSVLTALLLLPALALAALPAVQPPVRYMALGDSIAAGYKAMPATAGYAYQLYLGRAFGNIPEVLFDNASVPGATSTDVFLHQVPQASRFAPNRVTISVGGNDLLSILQGADPVSVLNTFFANLTAMLDVLCDPTTGAMPEGGPILLHNLYTIPDIPGADLIVPQFNATMAGAVALMTSPGQTCEGRTVRIADVYNAFLGQQGLLLIERYQKKGIDVIEVHPTNKGHRVIEGLFRALIAQ